MDLAGEPGAVRLAGFASHPWLDSTFFYYMLQCFPPFSTLHYSVCYSVRTHKMQLALADLAQPNRRCGSVIDSYKSFVSQFILYFSVHKLNFNFNVLSQKLSFNFKFYIIMHIKEMVTIFSSLFFHYCKLQ